MVSARKPGRIACGRERDERRGTWLSPVFPPGVFPGEDGDSASSVLGFLPLLAVFLLLQRQIAQGVASTGIR